MEKGNISVVVATLNSAKTLDWTLLSLLKQRDCSVHTNVIDGGSTDETINICKKWNVRANYLPPGNMYQAINEGFVNCHSTWYAYLNSDDWIYPASFARLISLGEATGADIVYGDCDYNDSSGRFLYSFAAANPSQLTSLFRMGVLGFAQPAAIFRKKIYEQLNGFNEYYRLSADYDFYFRAALAGAHIERLRGPSVACFRLHKHQLSRTQATAMQLERRDICGKLAGRMKLVDLLRFGLWRMANLPHYILRFLRVSIISNRIKITKSIDEYEDC